MHGRWVRGLVRGAAAGVIAGSAILVVPNGPTASAVADAPLSGTASTMWQTNNTVYTLAVSGGTVYAGGSFTAVRPPGSAAGTNETTRTYLAAFNANTGALVTNFNVTLNGRVRSLAVSPSGNRLYIAGDFTTVNGVAKTRIASIVLPNGNLDAGFTANASAAVSTIMAGPTAVYAGGDFLWMNGQARTRLAALNPTTGANVPTFAATVSGRINAGAVAANNSRLLIGGVFDQVNGVDQGGVASLDPITGALRPWAATGIAPRPLQGGCDADVTDILISGALAYVTAAGREAGCWEGTYKANLADGSLIWNAECLGAGQSIALVGGHLYRGSHLHDCGRMVNGFVGPRSSDDFIWYRLAAQDAATGEYTHWTPNTNGAGVEHVGPNSMATDGTQLFVGGDFTTVNGTGQQGITRFRPTGANSTPVAPAAPTVTPTGQGTLTVAVATTSDREDGTLTYALFRDGELTPLDTWTVESFPWSLPELRYDDTGLAPNTTHTYRVTVTDGAANAQSPASIAALVPAADPPNHATTIATQTPAISWSLDDTGPAVADSSGNGSVGTLVGGVTTGVAGAVDDATAMRFDGVTGAVASNALVPRASALTLSAWFRSTSQVGGSIVGFGDTQTGLGLVGERAIWMDNNGEVAFGVRTQRAGRNPAMQVVRGRYAYNDGAWHHVSATFDGANLAIYLDGVLQGNSALASNAPEIPTGDTYLRVGNVDLRHVHSVFGTNFSGQPAPINHFFTGDIDAVSYWTSVLTPPQIAAQYVGGVATQLPPPPPPPAPTYAAVIGGHAPAQYWRLGEAAGNAVVDSSINNRPGTYRAGLTFGVAGPLATGGNTAVTSPGTSGLAYSNASVAAPTTFSVETWIRTTSVVGGKIVGFEATQTGWGATFDRHVYMTNNGRLTYGIVAGGTQQTVLTAASYNDGNWHHVVATQGAAGMTLYVDGVAVGTNPTVTPDAATGFWRLGGGNLTGWSNRPTSSAMSGQYDEFAIYDVVLTPAQVAAHYAARLL